MNTEKELYENLKRRKEMGIHPIDLIEHHRDLAELLGATITRNALLHERCEMLLNTLSTILEDNDTQLSPATFQAINKVFLVLTGAV